MGTTTPTVSSALRTGVCSLRKSSPAAYANLRRTTAPQSTWKAPTGQARFQPTTVTTAKRLAESSSGAEPELAMTERQLDAALHFRHALEQRQRPAGCEHIDDARRVARLQQPVERLRHNHVTNPGRADDKDLFASGHGPVFSASRYFTTPARMSSPSHALTRSRARFAWPDRC